MFVDLESVAGDLKRLVSEEEQEAVKQRILWLNQMEELFGLRKDVSGNRFAERLDFKAKKLVL